MRLAWAVSAVLSLSALAAGGLWAYDRSRDDLVPEGVEVGGVDVGGLRADEARAALDEELARPLERPLTVQFRGRSFTLTAAESRVRADVGEMLAEALAAGRRGSFVSRGIRDLGGGTLEHSVPLRVHYRRQAVTAFLRHVRDALARSPRDARIAYSGAGLTGVRGRPGRRVEMDRLRRQLLSALTSPTADKTIAASVMPIRPRNDIRELAERNPVVLVVNRQSFTLKLYRRLRLYRTYEVSVGQPGYETPAGLYEIQNKDVDPAWHVPNSDWAGELAGKVIPGGAPENPLKARWLGIYAGTGIHGTDDVGSIGRAASHGCIRMRIPEVKELYEIVPVGAPIYIA